MSINFGARRYFTPCDDSDGNCQTVAAEHDEVIDKLDQDNDFLKTALAQEKLKLDKCAVDKQLAEREVEHMRVLGNEFSREDADGDESPSYSKRIPSTPVDLGSVQSHTYPILTRGVTRMGCNSESDEFGGPRTSALVAGTLLLAGGAAGAPAMEQTRSCQIDICKAMGPGMHTKSEFKKQVVFKSHPDKGGNVEESAKWNNCLKDLDTPHWPVTCTVGNSYPPSKEPVSKHGRTFKNIEESHKQFKKEYPRMSKWLEL